MKNPFKLVNSPVSHDSAEALRVLLTDAEKGALIGIAFAAMYKKGDYIVDLAGEAYRSPTFSRGMVMALDDYLKSLVHEEN